VSLIDSKSPAAGIITAQLLEFMNLISNPKIAEFLLVAIASDTGWFSYNNTTAECFSWSAKFIQLGARHHYIYEKLYLSDSPQRFRLIARAMSSAEILLDGKLIVMSLSKEDFSISGANEGHTENIIDLATRIRTMLVSVMFVMRDDGVVRVSLRSRPGFDVAKFANQFGGGGHPRAAGLKLNGDFRQVKEKVVSALIEELNNPCSPSKE
jgi:phosphoesterase RecJ-like protein